MTTLSLSSFNIFKFSISLINNYIGCGGYVRMDGLTDVMSLLLRLGKLLFILNWFKVS